MTGSPLIDLELATRHLDEAKRAHVAAIVRAVKSGASLREVAAVAGVSHEWVRRLASGNQ